VDASAPIARWMRRHVLAYLLVIGSLNLVNYLQGPPWWAFWASMGWGVLLAIHYLIYKCMTIDEEWVDERAYQVREHSYDFDHMKDLEQRIIDDDFSVRAHTDERGGRPAKED
jgi:hypothetical protein